MQPLRYLRAEAVDALFDCIRGNLADYKEGNFKDRLGEDRSGEVPGVSIDGAQLDQLDPTFRRSAEEVANALCVYRALRGLTPRLARREGVWAYLTHGPCLGYTRQRWLHSRLGPTAGDDSVSPEEKEEKHLVANVERRFFARGDLRQFRANALALLWWNAHIASRCERVDQKKVLEILFYDANLRDNIFDRPSLYRNPNVLSAMMEVLAERYDDEERRDRFIRRRTKKPQVSVAHGWLQKVNFVGGARLLESLEADELRGLFSTLATEAEKEFRDRFPPADPGA